MTVTDGQLIAVRPTGGFRLWLRFSDGLEGEVDLCADLNGPVFEPLRNPVEFLRLRLDSELHTLVWPNGADFAPEFLREKVSAGRAA